MSLKQKFLAQIVWKNRENNLVLNLPIFLDPNDKHQIDTLNSCLKIMKLK